MSSSPSPFPSPRMRNEGTRPFLARAARLSPEDAYAMALALDRARAPQREPGHRLYWMTGTTFGSRDVPATRSGFAVLGRHTQCDGVLDDDPSLALRHLLVRSACLDDGLPMLSVMDLRSHEGFELSDGTEQRSILATGPVVLRVGVCAVVALPSGEPPAASLPIPVCTSIDAHPYRIMARPVGPDPVARPALVSRITLLPRASMVSEPSRTGGSASGGAGEYELFLRSPGGHAGVRLSAQDLAHGVLVGRALKCVDAGLRAVLDSGISRVHALLLRDRNGCFAYDTASTQGTYHDGHAVRCVPLHPEGTRFYLGTCGVQAYWRAV